MTSEWLRVSLLLSVYGFLKEFRPSEPFIVNFITGKWRNVTAEQVNREVFPVGTYSYLSLLVFVFLVTDALRYKPVVVVAGGSGVIAWILLTWTKSLKFLQVMQVFYGLFLASEVAYFTYIYAKVDKKHYQKVTSHTRAALFGGRFLSAMIGQMLLYFDFMNVKELNYITVASLCLATLWAIFLPSVQQSLYFHRQPNDTEEVYRSAHPGKEIVAKKKSSAKKIQNAFWLLYFHFKDAYRKKIVLQWSVLYAGVLCGYLLVISYIQVLWTNIDSDIKVNWNGVIEGTVQLAGTLVAIFTGCLKINNLNGKTLLLFCSCLSLCQAGALLLACFTKNLYISYLGYLLYYIFYSFLITISSAEVAKNLIDDSFGLVFGINTLLGLLAQSIITILLVTEGGFILSITQQFFIFGIYHFVLCGLFVIYIFLNFLCNRFKKVYIIPII